MPGELLVRFEPTMRGAEVRGALSGEDATVRERLPVGGLRLVDLPAGTSVSEAVGSLEELPGVIYAEPNYRRELARVSSDPLFGQQWALRNTGQEVFGSRGIAGADERLAGAWDRQLGSPSVTVAVVDSGVALDHPDLDGNLWSNADEIPGNGIDDDANGYIDDSRGWDFIDRDPTPSDTGDTDQGHGTHVAGIIGAEGANGLGIAGVNWRVSLMALRAYGSVADEIAAFAYARDNGARVVNYSAGSSIASQAERDLIEASPGVLFVAAAGNDRLNNDAGPVYPCSYPAPNVVCVASSGQDDSLSRFSNFGPASVDLVAPGERVLSTWPAGAIAAVFREELNKRNLRDWNRRGGKEADRTLRSPRIDLSVWRSCVLTFAYRSPVKGGRIKVQVSRRGKGYRRVRRLKARRAGTRIVALPRRFGMDRSARLRFTLPGGAKTGPRIEFAELSCEATRNTWAYEDGTSFAAPQVSGAAGLVLAQHPAYSTAELRQALLGTVDVRPALFGKVVSSGRLNVAAAVAP